MLSASAALIGFAACGSATFVMVIALLARGIASRSWRIEQARITELEISETSVEDRSLNLELTKRTAIKLGRILYQYKVGDVPFSGHSAFILGFKPLGGASTRRFLSSFNIQKGATINIFVNPRQPTEVVICRGVPLGNALAFGLICTFSCIALALSAIAFHPRGQMILAGLLIGTALSVISLVAAQLKAKSEILK